MSLVYTATSAVAEIAPVSFQAERAQDRVNETRRVLVASLDLPVGVQPIGEILPLVLNGATCELK